MNFKKAIDSILNIDEIINFNANERNQWVAEKAGEVSPGSKILDVGAGECVYRHLFNHCDYKTQDFCQYPGTKQGVQQEDWGYGPIDYVSDIASIPAPDQSFDVVLCTEVLEHVPQPIDALREMARLLKPGGTLYLSAPLGSGLHQQPFHFYGGFTPHFYKKFLGDFGLDVQEITPIGGLFKHVGQELHRVGRVLQGQKYKKFRFWHSFIFMQWLPRYLAGVEKDILIEEFTVGYLVKATKQSNG